VLQGTAWVSSRSQADYRTCSDRSTTLKSANYVYPNDVRTNMNLCIETDEGRLALLHIDRFVLQTSGHDFDVVAFTVTVWEKAP
jgi:hypothetical protein